MKPPAPKKVVYFVRHGECVANATPVFQSPDSPLTDLGKEQVRRIAERAAKLSFETLIASPLARTKETAAAISEATGKVPEYSELFVERRKPEGLAGKSQFNPLALRVWNNWNKSLYVPGMRVGDGENFDDLMLRSEQALRFLEERPERELLVVTHAFFLSVLIARVILGNAFSGDTLRNFYARSRMENTGLTALTYARHLDGVHWRLWVYNDHAHLA